MGERVTAGRTRHRAGTVGRRRLVVVLVGACLAVGLATAAQANHDATPTGAPEAGEIGGTQRDNTSATNTDVTPRTQEGESGGWTRIAGARFGGATPRSLTPFDADFFSVDFEGEEVGLIGGAQCRRDPAKPDDAVPSAEYGGCERVPIIYRYAAPPGQLGTLKESYRGAYETDPGGFVGAIAWIAPGKALAVGGTGRYPRRELERKPGESDSEYANRDEEEGAGRARAWLLDPSRYDDDEFHELRQKTDGDPDDEIPDTMRGLSALACSPYPDQEGYCVAGALGQLWTFKNGSFASLPVTSASGAAGLAGPIALRIRDIRFPPGESAPDDAQVFAVSAGCCSGSPITDSASLYRFDGTNWTVDKSQAGSSSYYSLFLSRSGETVRDAETVAPGGPEKPLEGGSSVGGSSPCPPGGCAARLVAADGDLTRACVDPQFTGIGGGESNRNPCGKANPPDGVPDWAVGVLRSSGRGIAYTTATVTRRLAGPFPSPYHGGGPIGNYRLESCTGEDATHIADQTDASYSQDLCTPAGYLKSSQSKGLFMLPSYALNAYRAVGAQGIGWAVGDHGAVLRLGDGPPIAGEDTDTSPPIKAHPPASLGAEGGYQGFHEPLSDRPGLVPPFGERHTAKRLPKPQFVPAGSPDLSVDAIAGEDVSSIAMSRDGSEGWAVGPGESQVFGSPDKTTLYRFDGLKWARCGVYPNGPVPADPTCEDLARLGDLYAIARVPLERDSDPANDDEFEAVAVGVDLNNKPLIVRYADARWNFDQGGTSDLKDGISNSRLVDVSFSAPDDGWAVLRYQQIRQNVHLYHFDGEHWLECNGSIKAKQQCGDPTGRLPLNSTEGASLRLASAGSRTYLIGTRMVGGAAGVGSSPYPMIIYKDPGGTWTGGIDTTPDDDTYNPTDGGWDPGCAHKAPPAQNPNGLPVCVATGKSTDHGRVFSLSAAQNGDGSWEGWAVGQFGGTPESSGGSGESTTAMLRLHEGAWSIWSRRDASTDYLLIPGGNPPVNPRVLGPQRQLTLPQPSGGVMSYIFPDGKLPPLRFDKVRERWVLLADPTASHPPPLAGNNFRGHMRAVAPDGQGGLWVAIRAQGNGTTSLGTMDRADLYFYHYTDRPPEPVFAEVANPSQNTPITAAAGGADGTFWLGDQNGALYRYDRVGGWSSGIRVPDWDPKRATATHHVAAIAVNSQGTGIAVGEDGRIADIEPGSLTLDVASDRNCSGFSSAPPCSTALDLNKAAVAPDGSALAAGPGLALVWRPAGGDFRLIAPPAVSATNDITGVAMPRPERAYLALSSGQIYRGDRGAGRWNWTLESTLATEFRRTPTPQEEDLPGLSAIAVDASGHGYAVGYNGLILERIEEVSSWRQLQSDVLDDFKSVALPPSGGSGALIGGTFGNVATVSEHGEVQVAHPADVYDPVNATFLGQTRVTAVALLPGSQSGEAEAWALQQGPSPRFAAWHRNPLPQALLHYSSRGSDPLLDPDNRARALSDMAVPGSGELSFAVFGKQDCEYFRALHFSHENRDCPPADGSNLTNEVIARRINEQIAVRASQPDGPAFSVFTGDAVEGPGGAGSQGRTLGRLGNSSPEVPIDRDLPHRNWVDTVAGPLAEAAGPVFGAIGGLDLGASKNCMTNVGCVYSKDAVSAGPNNQWRDAMAEVAPWKESRYEANDLSFERLATSGISQGEQGGATHYAFDVSRDGRKIARLVFADTSGGSLTASDPLQDPVEPGGQAAWLQQVLCTGEHPGDTGCTRKPDQAAIVVSNVPTYTNGPISPTETQTDATSFETILLKNKVSLVVSGHLGWNGLYWALAPGVHYPCPGGEYEQSPPTETKSLCDQPTEDLPVNPSDPGSAPRDLAAKLRGSGVDAPPALEGDSGLSGALPFLVSSSAGGKFNQGAESTGGTTAQNGFWHGYSIVHLDPDTGKVAVEQRPVLDWIGIRGSKRSLRPGQRLALTGYGREPSGIDHPMRFIDIPANAAITHCYDLLYADPEKPWLPLKTADASEEQLADQGPGCANRSPMSSAPATNSARADASSPEADDSAAQASACAPYVCLPASIGKIDDHSGTVKAGSGDQERTYALAVLSVGEQVATYPLAFEPRPSFSNVRPPPTIPPPPPPPPAPAPNPPPGGFGNLTFPTPPTLPGLPIAAELQPPVPPIPAPPASAASAAPLSLFLSTPGISIAPQSSVVPPPAPPIQPAPPGGARKEARQRQAAAQKSGSESGDESASQAQEFGGDMADAPPTARGAEMTRRDNAFTARASSPQQSAWARNLQWGGGMTLMALVLALGWATVRPTPRRREPELPAPAWNHRSRRGP